MVQIQKKPVVPLTLFFWPLQYYEKGGARGKSWEDLRPLSHHLEEMCGRLLAGHHQGTTVGIPSRSEELDWGAHRLQHVPGRLDTPSPV